MDLPSLRPIYQPEAVPGHHFLAQNHFVVQKNTPIRTSFQKKRKIEGKYSVGNFQGWIIPKYILISVRSYYISSLAFLQDIVYDRRFESCVGNGYIGHKPEQRFGKNNKHFYTTERRFAQEICKSDKLAQSEHLYKR